MRRSRPNPSLPELYQMDDKVVHEFVDSYKESVSQDVKNNISIEDDASSWLQWKSLNKRFHKLKDLQELEERVSWLKKHLEMDDDKAPVISSHFISCNYSILSEKGSQIAGNGERVSTNNEILPRASSSPHVEIL